MKRLVTRKVMIEFIVCSALFAGSCVNSPRNEANKIGDPVYRLSCDTLIGVDHLDSAFIQAFYKRYSQFATHRDRVVQFYAKRDDYLAWTSKGLPKSHAKLLVNLVQNVNKHGLPKHKNIYNIRDTLSLIIDIQANNDSSAIALRKSFDLALTSLYFQYAPTIWQGSVDPHHEAVIDWFIQPNKISYQQMLDSILKDKRTDNPFIDYRQFNPQYLKLKQQLQRFSSATSEEEPTISNLTKPFLLRGDSASVVGELSKRLSYFGDLSSTNESYVYNSKIENAVKQFQARHGLKADGVVGKATLHALSVPLKDRMRQIMVNMERWRWVPPGMYGDYIYVNLAQFELSIYRNNKMVDRMKVIIGKKGSETIVFNDNIKYIVINPYWNIPRSIAIKEILPQIKKDKNYLAVADIEVGINWNFEILDPDTIDWDKITESNFDYTLRKKPGPDNPLGRIKFIFPNDFAIYLHDTPAKELFNEHDRGFSHGCIRVEKPLLLADRLLVQMSRAVLQSLLNGQQDNWITLPQQMPIYILYFTAWVDEQNKIHFTDDIYGHDADLSSVLFN